MQGPLGRMELEKIFISQEAGLAVERVAARAYQEHTEGQRSGKSLRKLPIPVDPSLSETNQLSTVLDTA